MNHGLIPYVGGKHRLADRLVEACASTGADVLVDVFGGSAAVLLAAVGTFQKLIYNDVDGDLVNLFRVVSNRGQRIALFQALHWLPPSRRIFNDDYNAYLAGGFSFCQVADPVERARKTLYRHCFSFGGKVRSGGFAISKGDRQAIKEVTRYRNVLKKLVRIGTLFRTVVIENLHYADLIAMHGKHPHAVLFIDPPYVDCENYYSRSFTKGDHTFLAQQLLTCTSKVVATYYDHPLIRHLYSAAHWDWQSIQGTKNSCLTRGNKAVTNEFVLTKRSL